MTYELGATIKDDQLRVTKQRAYSDQQECAVVWGGYDGKVRIFAQSGKVDGQGIALTREEAMQVAAQLIVQANGLKLEAVKKTDSWSEDKVIVKDKDGKRLNSAFGVTKTREEETRRDYAAIALSYLLQAGLQVSEPFLPKGFLKSDEDKVRENIDKLGNLPADKLAEFAMALEAA